MAGFVTAACYGSALYSTRNGARRWNIGQRNQAPHVYPAGADGIGLRQLHR
jgi:hypothetical protein